MMIIRKFKLRNIRGAAEFLVFIGMSLIAIFVIFALFPSFITPYDPLETNEAERLAQPDPRHIMGTDYLGRDVFSRVVYGAKISLAIALLSISISLMCGTLTGLISGYIGGKVDRVLTLIMDALYAFPGLVLAIAIATMLGSGFSNIVIAITITYLPTYYRLVRGEVLSVKSETYVEAARAIGANDIVIMLRYILPNVTSSISVFASLNVTDVILTAATLGFLGLGVPPPTPDWGTDISIGRQFILSGYWWLMIFPGMMIILVAIGFNFFGEGLNELLNPQLRDR